MTPIRLFTYGTLMRGQANHVLLEGRSTFLGEAETTRPYGFRDYGACPGMTEEGGEGPIQGELYEIGGDLLERIDRLEGHPDLYQRTEIDVRWLGGTGAILRAYTYLINPPYVALGQEIRGRWVSRPQIEVDFGAGI